MFYYDFVGIVSARYLKFGIKSTFKIKLLAKNGFLNKLKFIKITWVEKSLKKF